MQPIISPVNFKNSSNVILIVNNDGTLQFFEKITLQLYIPHPLLFLAVSSFQKKYNIVDELEKKIVNTFHQEEICFYKSSKYLHIKLLYIN